MESCISGDVTHGNATETSECILGLILEFSQTGSEQAYPDNASEGLEFGVAIELVKESGMNECIVPVIELTMKSLFERLGGGPSSRGSGRCVT